MRQLSTRAQNNTEINNYRSSTMSNAHTDNLKQFKQELVCARLGLKL